MRIMSASICVILLSGCASKPSFTNTALQSDASASAVTQNWYFHATSTQYNANFDIGGSLTFKGTSVNGIFELTRASDATNGLCFEPGTMVTPITFQGTRSAAKLITISSVEQNQQVFNFSGPEVNTTIKGNYSLTGDCGGDLGTFSATWMQPIAGTYTGKLKNGQVLTLKLAQSASADSNGEFHLTGTRNVSTGVCGSAATVSIANGDTDTYVVGNQFLAVFAAGGVKTIVSGTFTAGGNNLNVSSGTYGDNCQDVTNGTLIR